MNKRWAEKLEWSGQREFNSAEWRGWRVSDDRELAGMTKSAGGMTFASVHAAGHMMSTFCSFVCFVVLKVPLRAS